MSSTLATGMAAATRAPGWLRLPARDAALFLVALLAFNVPLVAFALAAALLINLPDSTPDGERRLLGLVLVVAVSMMMSSRPVSAEGSDDLVGYYDLYLEFRSGDYERLFQFGGGLEIGLTSLFCLWAWLLPKLSPNGLMLCMTLTSALLFWAWVESTFYGKRSRQRDTALIGAALLLFNVYFSTQLARQFLALVVLLYAFSATTPWRRLLLIALAATFHLTALVSWAVFWLVRQGRLGILVVVGAAMLVRWYFPTLLTLLDVLPAAVVEKLAYYVENNDEITGADLATLRLLGLLCAISLLGLAAQGFRLDARGRAWHAGPWLAAVVHVLLLPIPLASLRTTLAVHSVATGVFAYQLITGRHRLLLLTLLNTLLVYKLAGFWLLEGDAGQVCTLSVLLKAVE